MVYFSVTPSSGVRLRAGSSKIPWLLTLGANPGIPLLLLLLSLVYECVFVVPLSLLMQTSDGQTLTPNRSRNTWVSIFYLGLKCSRGGPGMLVPCSQPESYCSSRNMLVWQDHDPLQGSWSSAKTMIVSQQYDSPSKSWPGAPPQIKCSYGHKIDMLISFWGLI